MSFSGLPQFVAAVIGKLRSDAGLAQRVTGVFDEVPKAVTGNYIVIDEPFETRDGSFGQNGHDVQCTISIVLQSPASSKLGRGKAGYLEGLSIANDVLALLTDIENNPLEVDDHDVVDVDVVTVDSTRESDGITRRVDVTISATLEDVIDTSEEAA